MKRFLLRLLAPADLAVLDEMAAIPEAALRRWIGRNFGTVAELARAELRRRGLEP